MSTPLARISSIRAIAGAFMFVLITASSVPSLADPPKPAGADGTYVNAADNYRIDVKFEEGKLSVVEPNKTSVYTQRAGTLIYDFVDASSKTAYVLEVNADGKSLKAYKPQTPENVTLLTLKAATPTTCSDKVHPILVRNTGKPEERLWGAKGIDGVNLVGTYRVEVEHPYAILKADGTGTFETYGAPKSEFIHPINWWVQANCDGTLVETDRPAGKAYFIILEFKDRAEGEERFVRRNLAVQKAADGKIFIMDRSKPK